MKKQEKNRDNVVPMRGKLKKKPVTKQEVGLLIGAVLLLLGILIFVFSQCSVKTLVITGNESYTQDEVEAAVRQSCFQNTVIDTVLSKFSKNDYLPFIERSEVRFLGKNTLKIEVHEKLRAGVLKEMSEYFYFDKDGIVREESESRLKNVPLVSGLKMEDCVLNEKIKPREDGVFAIILKITQLIIKYDLPVQEIQFNTLTDIRLKTPNVQVRLGTSSELDAKIGELPSIFRELTGMEGVLNMESYTEEKKVITFRENKEETKKTEKNQKDGEGETGEEKKDSN